MADLGSIGRPIGGFAVFALGRNARSIDAAANVARARPFGAVTIPVYPGDRLTLSGHLTVGGSGVARHVRALHRVTSAVLDRTVSDAGTGAFTLHVPACAAGVDVQALAVDGDGCDIFLPARTPV